MVKQAMLKFVTVERDMPLKRAAEAERASSARDLLAARDAAEAAGFSLGGLAAVENGPEGAYHARYAVSRAGTYELHVRLRSTSEALPGSPFILSVTGGAAHAPTT